MSDGYEEELEELLQELSEVKADNRRLRNEKEMREYRENNENNHICDEYGDNDCPVCLQIWRMERYGSDVHDARCQCNECNGYGYRGDY